MLVRVGQTVQGPEDWIPSLIRFYLVKNQTLNWGTDGVAFRSVFDGSLKLAPFFSDWKETLSDGFLVDGVSNGPTMVECRSNVLNRVTEDEIQL
jgi:hypothetical protein